MTVIARFQSLLCIFFLCLFVIRLLEIHAAIVCLFFIHIIFKYPHVWRMHDTLYVLDRTQVWWSMCNWKEKKEEIVVQVRLWCMQLIIYYSCMCFRARARLCAVRVYLIPNECMNKMSRENKFFFFFHDTDKCNPISMRHLTFSFRWNVRTNFRDTTIHHPKIEKAKQGVEKNNDVPIFVSLYLSNAVQSTSILTYLENSFFSV